MQKTTPIVLNLIIINAIVFIAQLMLDKSIQLTNYLALYSYNTGLFKPYQLVTHMFAHDPQNYFHIIFNMYALWLLGSILERFWGAKRFLIFYLACGLAAGVTQMFLVNGAAIGASGAIMGLMAGFAYLFPNTEFYLMFIPIPIKAKYLVAMYAAYDLFLSKSADGIAHFAHLGGLLMGFILVIIWNKTNKKTFY